MRIAALFLTIVLVVPFAGAEFGAEDPHGHAVGVDGPIEPFVYQHWIDKNPEVARLVDDWLQHRSLVDDEDEPINTVGDATLFPYYPILVAEMQRLASEHPDLARLHSAGTSRLGLDLWYLEIADFAHPDSKPLAEREVVYLDGGTHSNEYSGVYFVTEWAQFLLDEYETNETARWIVENRHTFILPMVNPDGSNAMGRINALTVNINRNFPSTWGTVAADQPPLNWGGPWPASEPETQAVMSVIEQARPDYVNSIHCCGNLWLHPYGAEQLGHAPDFEMFNNTCIEVFPDLIFNVSRVRCGETWSTIYPASGTTLDEGYGLVGASSWTYEMSGRSDIPHATWGYPVTMADPREQEHESWRGVLHAFLNVERYGAHPVVTAVEGDSDQLRVTVHNDGLGPVEQGFITVAGQSVSLGHIPVGATATYDVAGAFKATQVPVEVEWKKRIHPDSNWGHTLDAVQLVADGARLQGVIEALDDKPSMAALMPDVAIPAPQEPLDDDEDEKASIGVPGIGIALVATALLAASVVRRRRAP